jgi:pilus assembly protein CpaD
MLTSTRILGGSLQLAAFGLALLAGGCNTDGIGVASAPYPSDFRDRHPIKLAERERAIEIHVGSGHGRLTVTQRAEVAAFARAWRRESSGLLIVDVPDGTRDALAARGATHEITAVLAAMGVPQAAIERRTYRPTDPASVAAVRIAYPMVQAVTGPCGQWIDDIGPGSDGHLIQNDSFWNHGCASQRNLAAIVANPEDLVQPRAEGQVDAARRQQVLDKWRQATDPSTTYTQKSDSKVSTVGQ